MKLDSVSVRLSEFEIVSLVRRFREFYGTLRSLAHPDLAFGTAAGTSEVTMWDTSAERADVLARLLSGVTVFAPFHDHGHLGESGLMRCADGSRFRVETPQEAAGYMFVDEFEDSPGSWIASPDATGTHVAARRDLPVLGDTYGLLISLSNGRVRVLCGRALTVMDKAVPLKAESTMTQLMHAFASRFVRSGPASSGPLEPAKRPAITQRTRSR